MAKYIITDALGTTYTIYAHHVLADKENGDSISFYATQDDQPSYMLVAQFTKANIIGFFLDNSENTEHNCKSCKYQNCTCEEYPCRDCNYSDMWEANEGEDRK